MDLSASRSRGLLSLMRRRDHKLTSTQRTNLARYIESVDGLRPLYKFRSDLIDLLSHKHKTAR